MGIHKNDTIERVLQSHIRRRHRIDVLNQIVEVITNYAPKDSRMQRMSVYVSLKKTHSCQYSSNMEDHSHNSPGFGMVQRRTVCESHTEILCFGLACCSWQASNMITDEEMEYRDKCNMYSLFGTKWTRSHLFFQCFYSETIWKRLVAWLLGSDYTALWDNILQDSTRDKTTLFLVRYAFQVTVHSVWRERDGRRHGESSTSAMQLGKLIEKQIWNKSLH